MSIPILWQDPFSLKPKPLFITGYFSSLDEGEKTILRNCGITAEFSETLFNYARFLKTLYPTQLKSKVEEWIQISGFDVATIQPVIILLVKTLILNGTTLQQFSLNGSFIDPEILYSLRQAGQYLSRLQALHLSLTTEVTGNGFLRIFSINTLSQLSLTFRSEYEPQVYDDLARIIHLQKRLERFWISGYSSTKLHGIIPALESQKKSLQEIILKNCVYNTEFEALKSCDNLETLRIRRSNINLSEIFNENISNLDIINSPEITTKDMRLILRKYGKSILKLKLQVYDGELLKNLVSLKEIGKFCPNITQLFIKRTKFSTQLIRLIGNLQKLQALLLWCDVDNIPKKELKERVIEFAEILPLTLQYLQLSGWLQPYLDIFLDHCKEPLKNLLTDQLKNKKNLVALKC
ncbi:hypothetical protein C2G38_2235490 [Gigaspora rosea]|uniref:F-box domain-containing protein n=1 Tax=Gigaspora rosea TaxID=44941 RepID=A0A397TPL9_9GLOM|nr:hypothetical protein C2G38_2235490 [Gigaspora rosea]